MCVERIRQVRIVAAFALAAMITEAFSATSAPPLSPRRSAQSMFTVPVESAPPPNGWTEFCVRYAPECDQKASNPHVIALNRENWEAIIRVNKWVNERINPIADVQHWGRANVWHYAEDGWGDCKDYVLLKQRTLAALGLPREALLITIVWTKQDQGHAVLITRTNQGDFVLDSLSSDVVLWSDTDYDFVKRQSQTDPNSWVYIDGNTPDGGGGQGR